MLFEQDWIKNEWLSHHLLRSSSWRNACLLSRIRLYIMYVRTRAKTSVEHPLFSLHTAKCQTWGCVFNLHDNISLSSAGRLNSLCIDVFQRMPWYIYFGMLFHVIWNTVPHHMEQGYILALAWRLIKKHYTKACLWLFGSKCLRG